MKASRLAIAVACIPVNSAGCLDALQPGGGPDRSASCLHIENATVNRSATLECNECLSSSHREIQTQLQSSQLSLNISIDLRLSGSPTPETSLNSRVNGNAVKKRGAALTSTLLPSFPYPQAAYHA
jgi:hypothetical protein